MARWGVPARAAGAIAMEGESVLLSTFTVLLLATAVSACFYFASAFRRPVRLTALMVSGGVVLTLPILVPGEARLLRLFAAAYSALLCMKMWDLHVGVARGPRGGFRDYVFFLFNVASLVQRSRRAQGPSRHVRDEAKRLLWGGGVAGAGVVGFFWLIGRDWSAVPLLVEHGLKASTFFFIVTGLFHAAAALVRLLGGHAPPATTFPFFAQSPADFWRGLNGVVGEFLRDDVFRIVAARRHPRLAVLAAFAVSGLVHEYAFAMAIGRIRGLQMAFFMLHGIAVAVTAGHSGGGWVGRGATLTFNLLTSLLFLASFEGIAPGVFFQDGLPSLR